MHRLTVDPVGWDRHPLPHGHPYRCPSPPPGGKDQAGRPLGASLPPMAGRGESGVSLASLEMASSFPRCEIRQLLLHTYPAGHKGPGAQRVTVFYGRRGRPVKKPRFIPAERAPPGPACCRPAVWAPCRWCGATRRPRPRPQRLRRLG
jgi:hypothetical protein